MSFYVKRHNSFKDLFVDTVMQPVRVLVLIAFIPYGIYKLIRYIIERVKR